MRTPFCSAEDGSRGIIATPAGRLPWRAGDRHAVLVYNAVVTEHFNGSIGLRGTAELTVEKEHTAAFQSGGTLPAVLSTPRLLQLVEDATSSLAAQHLDEGYASVGFEVLLEHLAPSEIGDNITAEVLLEASEDRDLLFRFTVRDRGSLREVARGTQTRRIVWMEDFMRRLKQENALR
ncbi:MAG: thioesterase [Chloroflexi bacterium]|nr:thioesterase [Chloroflexota bacterium]